MNGAVVVALVVELVVGTVVVISGVVVVWTVVARQETVSGDRQINTSGSNKEPPGHVCR
jgi:hypothetical protein